MKLAIYIRDWQSNCKEPHIMLRKRASFSIFLVVFYPSLICLAATFNGSTDESSLLSLKAQITSKPNNILSTNWSRGTSFCTWIGVTCSRRHQRVTGLDLFNMGLEGTIAREVGNLSFLTYLSIANNSFRGVIPDEIGNLIRLRVLNMSFNQLGGNFPQTFGLLRNLEWLELAGNNLVGSMPGSIFNLSSLQSIRLPGNQLSGTLPNNICLCLPRLKYLLLASNQLSGEILTGLSSCGELKGLVLSNNSFTGSIPMAIGILSKLQTLDLFQNELTGGIPTAIGNLSQLEHLFLGRNKLTGNIQTQNWNLPILETLDLKENHLTGAIPPSIGNLSNLSHLVMDSNRLHGVIPSEIGFLPSLTRCRLGFNKLQGELPHSIFNKSTLRVLNLRENELFGTIPCSIADWLLNLEFLELSHNQFSGVIPGSISNLSRLSILNLNSNSFHGYIPTNLGNLCKLETMNLGANQFTNDLAKSDQEFITSLANCKGLKKLFVAYTPITGELPKSMGSSNFSASLEIFNFGHCQIGGGIPSEIGNLSSLFSLSVEYNDLMGTIPEALGGLRGLQSLDISWNNLRGSISDSLCNLKWLYFVDMSNNKLSGQPPRCLTNIYSLGIMNLSGNNFNSSIPSTLWLNNRIRSVNLSENYFDGHLPPEIGNMKSLVELDLSGNQLSGDLPSAIGQLQNLIHLSLSHNKLQGYISDSFVNLKDLHFLDLSDNHISGSIPLSLETLQYLEYFNVSFNELSGQIPNEGPFVKFSADLFKGNKGLCGASWYHVKACKRNTPKASSKMRILRYVLPTTTLLGVVIAILLIWFLRVCAERSTYPTPSDMLLGIGHERISHYEVLHATNNLDEANLIGRGILASVYKGIFSNSMTVAVKVFNLDVQGGLKSFDTECLIMRSICHRNLVKVITSCSNLDFKALVMEYMPNGNLDRWIYSNDSFLNIRQRLEIMIDVASALEYLHQDYSYPIVHCDLKPSNILLDEDMTAYVSDFGISKLLTEDQQAIQTKNLGTIGYIAPEFGSTGLISIMVDVYSYGILLMEIFTRKKPTDKLFSAEFTMKSWVQESLPISTMQIIDVNLLHMDVGSEINYERCLTLITRLALECTADVPKERPNVKDVVVRLKKIQYELDG